jgi:factor associated with neutral sphingomyelinase activation
LNSLSLDLGIQDNGNKVNNVELPKWADSVEQFIKKNIQALES